MRHTDHADRDLDSLIEEITVDCYGDDEALSAFEVAFDDEAGLPCPATVVGEQVQVISIGLRDGRRELIAVCQRAERRYDLALLDVTIDADPALSRLLAAHRRWLS
jgi:hypothetical protein